MDRMRRQALIISAPIALIVFGLWLVHKVRERHKAAEREANYQMILAKYTGELKPGVTRERVERYLQAVQADVLCWEFHRPIRKPCRNGFG